MYSLSKDAEDLNTVKQLQPLHKFTQQNLLNKINGLYVEKQMKPFKKSKGSQKRSKQTLKKQFNNKMNEYSSIEPNPVDICKEVAADPNGNSDNPFDKVIPMMTQQELEQRSQIYTLKNKKENKVYVFPQKSERICLGNIWNLTNLFDIQQNGIKY